MREFQKKRVIRRILESRVAFVALVIVVALLARATWSVYVDYKNSAELVVYADAEYKRLSEREEILAQNVKNLATPEGQEEEIRNMYNVAKEGEEIAIIVDPVAKAEVPEEKSKNFWQKVVDWFR